MAEGGAVEVTVDGIGSEGAGVGRLPDGRVVFVHRTAPKDRARIEVTRSGRRWARGRLVELVTAGVDRRAAPCPHYPLCGGCALQHLAYPAQLAAKGRIVTEALRRIGGREDVPSPALHAAPDPFHYRNRVTFTLRRFGDGSVIAGFHEVDEPGRILDIDERCMLPEAPIMRSWKGLRESWGPRAGRLPAGGELRLTLRATASKKVILLIAGGTGDGDAGALVSRVPELVAVWRLSGDRDGEPRLLAGAPVIEEEWLGEAVELRPAAFLQVNRRGADLLFRRVIQEMGEVRGRRVLDAYAGIGRYGRWAARAGARTVAIESDPGAVRMARTGPEAGFTMLEGRVEDRIEEALPADLVVLNPPRTGVDPEVMERIGAAAPDRIVYASCDPATLARDLGRLSGPYRISGLDVFDLFPQTAHVECVLTLERG